MESHPLLYALQQHMLKSLPEYSIIIGLLFVAAVANLPRPETVTSWLMDAEATWVKVKELVAISYKWFYDTMQAFMAARHPSAPTATPPPPAAPESSVKEIVKS